MNRTHMYFDESDLEKNDSPSAKRFRGAKAEYERMTYEEMTAWSHSVICATRGWSSLFAGAVKTAPHTNRIESSL